MDREKVIRGLECCKNKTMLWQHDQCQYHGFDEDCESNLHADALTLLKEQDEIIQRILSEKMDELNNKNMMLQNELQNIEMKKLVEQK